MIDNVTINTQSSIRIEDEKIIRFDPFVIDSYYNDADIIFITHSHYDHLSLEDIKKVMKEDTIFVIPETESDKLSGLNIPESNIIKVTPNNEYEVLNYKFTTIPSYNNLKPFHRKNSGWVGYIITINNKKYYIAGDTDITEENKQISCDVAFIPIGGTFTMNYKEGAELTNIIKPSIVVPIHYGSIVGKKKDVDSFKELVNPEIEVVILLNN